MRNQNTKKQIILVAVTFMATLAIFIITMQKSDAVELTGKNVGFIDVSYVINNSKTTQALKAKQDSLVVELQKYGIIEKEKMINSKTLYDKDNIEKELIEKVSAKKQDLDKEYKESFVIVQQKIKTAITQIQEEKQLSLVFTKESLVSGGVDITKDVINILDSTK